VTAMVGLRFGLLLVVMLSTLWMDCKERSE